MFSPRYTIPSSSDKRFIRIGYGGYNDCILGKPLLANGSVLANCVGYCKGRWLEIMELTTDYSKCKLRNNAAEDWWTNNDGYSRGQIPKLGAVCCWKYSDYLGHVAIVEDIDENGNITVSQSFYNGSWSDPYPYPYFYMNKYYKSKGYEGFLIGYKFQGFIYLPDEYLPSGDLNKKKNKNFKWILFGGK